MFLFALGVLFAFLSKFKIPLLDDHTQRSLSLCHQISYVSSSLAVSTGWFTTIQLQESSLSNQSKGCSWIFLVFDAAPWWRHVEAIQVRDRWVPWSPLSPQNLLIKLLTRDREQRPDAPSPGTAGTAGIGGCSSGSWDDQNMSFLLRSLEHEVPWV